MVGGCAVAHEEIVVIATASGYAKRTPVDEFPVQARGGSGVKAAKIDKARGGRLAAVAPATETVAFLTRRRRDRGAESRPVRAAARDGGGSKVAGVSGSCRARRRGRRTDDAPATAPGFSIVFQSRVVT